jgi:hypothetical protein
MARSRVSGVLRSIGVKGRVLPAFEYLLLFASVILGLAVCELAIACNRLFAERKVRWDWLSPVAALLVFLKLVTQWWAWRDALPLAAGITFEMYVAFLIGAVVLFMMAAAALPSGRYSEECVDLRAYYASTSRRFWILFALHFTIATGTVAWMQLALEHSSVRLALPTYFVVPVALSLAFTRNRMWHTVALLGFCALYLFQSFGETLPS